MSTVGDNILRLRKELGLTQEELAKRMGYKSKSSINKIELGLNDIPRNKIVKFAEVLGTTPARLMGQLTVGTITNKTIAHNIQYHRENANLTQQQFANLLGVDKKTVVDLESGQSYISKDMRYKICDVLKLIPSNIISRDNEEFDEDTAYLLSRREKNTPGELKLTEGEKMLLDLFRQIPEDAQKMYLEVLRASLKNQP